MPGLERATGTAKAAQSRETWVCSQLLSARTSPGSVAQSISLPNANDKTNRNKPGTSWDSEKMHSESPECTCDSRYGLGKGLHPGDEGKGQAAAAQRSTLIHSLFYWSWLEYTKILEFPSSTEKAGCRRQSPEHIPQQLLGKLSIALCARPSTAITGS